MSNTPKYILDRARGWTYVCESNRRITIGMAWDEAEQIRNKLNAHDELVEALRRIDIIAGTVDAANFPVWNMDHIQKIASSALAKVQA